MQAPIILNKEPAARTNRDGFKLVFMLAPLTSRKDRSNGFVHAQGGRV